LSCFCDQLFFPAPECRRSMIERKEKKDKERKCRNNYMQLHGCTLDIRSQLRCKA